MDDLTRLETACETTARAQDAFRAADLAGSGHVAAASVLMEACADLSKHVPGILALITRLRAAEARTAWQPIETAPRDCCVIAWADEWARPDVAWYCAGAWWSGCGSPCPEITHWQPLPAAPEAP